MTSRTGLAVFVVVFAGSACVHSGPTATSSETGDSESALHGDAGAGPSVDAGVTAPTYAVPPTAPGCLPAGLRWGDIGGRGGVAEASVIEGCRTFRWAATRREKSSECRVELSEATAKEINAALKNPEVVSAFAEILPGESTIFGFDDREADGSIWMLWLPPSTGGADRASLRPRSVGIGTCRAGSKCESRGLNALHTVLGRAEQNAMKEKQCVEAKKNRP